jgi:hypothetical protein
MHLARHRFRLRVDPAYRPGQVLGRAVRRADDELAPQRARALDVDEHPAGQPSACQQPCAPLQRDRFAERAVVQQQPGHGRDHVRPPGHGPDHVARRLVRPS